MAKAGSQLGMDSIPGRNDIVKYLISNYEFETAIDVGCGKGDFFYYLDKVKPNVQGTGIDMMDEELREYKNFEYIHANFNNYVPDKNYDLIFSSHTVEHNTNTEEFLRSFFKFAKPGGTFCIIWPPPKPQIVGGHVHVFNLGLMLYNIVRIGVDCRNVKLVRKGYNLCIMGEVNFFDLPELTYNRFEIAALGKWFPFAAKQGFNGDNPPGTIILK